MNTAERRFLILSVAFPPFILAAFLLGYFARSGGATGDLTVVAEAYQNIQDRYHGAVESEKLRHGAVEGMVGTLDEHCVFFTKEEWDKFNAENLEGKFGGVGIVVEPDADHGYILVVSTINDTPAARAGIMPGDRIIAVNGQTLKNRGTERAVQWIRGDIGTQVTLSIWRGDKDPFDVKLIRAKISVPALQTRIIDPEHGIGYIRIIQFQQLMEEFDAKYAELAKQDLKALVIDLRFNGGGLLKECVALADRFIDEGVIVTTRSREGDVEGYNAARDTTRVRMPVVVLVNESTASASEIFAGAIKDHKRGALVGTRTFGKGSVQTPMPLSDGSWIKITTARYYTPAGVSVHREKGKKEFGLEPNYLIETTAEETTKIFQRLQEERYGKSAEGFTDPQLEAALEILKANLENRAPKVEPRLVKKDANPGD